MGILSGVFKSRDKPQNTTSGSAYRFFIGGSSSGKNVNERSTMQMTAVYSCVRILSEAVASLPLHVYKYNGDGGKEKVVKHPLYFLLHDEPNPEMTSFVFRETLMTHLFGVGLPILLPIFWGLDGVLLFMPVADVLTGIASIWVIVRTNKELGRNTTSAAVITEKRVRVKTNPDVKGIITIGRSYSSGGRTVGKLIAEQLGIPYYDSELLERAAEKSGLSKKFLESMDEKAVKSQMLYSYTGFTGKEHSQIETIAANAQRGIIEKRNFFYEKELYS